MEKDIRVFARECALRRLDRRECSTQDVIRHLVQKEVPSDIALEVVSHLQTLNLISDERFARLLAREQALRGKGPHVVRQKLREKGIQLDLEKIKTLIEEVSLTDELTAARALLARKYPDAWQDKKQELKALQALVRRGYSFSVAREALASQEHFESDDFKS